MNVNVLVIALSALLHLVGTADALADCVPISQAYHRQGVTEAAQACCSLSPFDSICTDGRDSTLVNMTSSASSSFIQQAIEALPAAEQVKLAATVPLDDLSKTVTLTADNPTAKFDIILPGLRLISGTYTLIPFPDPQKSFAVNGVITTSFPQPCQVKQMVGSIGIPALFADATCITISDSTGSTCPWSFCGLVHDSTLPNAAWFGLAIGDRLFSLNLLTPDNATQKFSVNMIKDCLKGVVGDIRSANGQVSIIQDPASGKWVLQVDSVDWTDQSIHFVNTPQKVLSFDTSLPKDVNTVKPTDK